MLFTKGTKVISLPAGCSPPDGRRKATRLAGELDIFTDVFSTVTLDLCVFILLCVTVA